MTENEQLKLGIIVQNECTESEWNLYVSSRDAANIYHTHEWSDVLTSSFGYKPYHLIAKNEDGEICGILPLMLVENIFTGKRLVSLPFSYSCGPVVDTDSVLIVLLEEAKRLCGKLHCDYLELKVIHKPGYLNADSPWVKSQFKASEQFSTFMLDLSQPDTVWKKLDPKGVRWAVGKAKRDGITIRQGNSDSDIQEFYQLNLSVKKRIGVPGHPKCLFDNMFAKLGDRCSLYLAEFQGKIIGGIITQKFGDIVLYGYGASDDKYRVHQPNSLLVWTAIEDACKEGFQVFDFGRTSPAEQKLTSFKRHWGTREVKLAYYYYPRIPGSLALNDTGMKYKIVTGLWRKMPLPFARASSNIIFRHLG